MNDDAKFFFCLGGFVGFLLFFSISFALHGNATFALCLNCNEKIDLGLIHEEFKETNKPPLCNSCNGYVKTATISFGQPMPEIEMQRAQLESLKADLFIVVGSSLVVFPAASLPLVAKENGGKTSYHKSRKN